MQVWQIAAGERGRYYDDLFLEHDVMFLGPGRFGDMRTDAAQYAQAVKEKRISGLAAGMVRRFEKDIQPGDLMLLRRGQFVLSIGLITRESDYCWLKAFDDVYGWDVEHSRRVAWQRQHDEKLKVLQSARGLFRSRKQIPTFTRVNDRSILEPVSDLLRQVSSRPLKELPAVSEPLSIEDIGHELFAKGLAHRSVENVLDAIARQRRLDSWYENQPLTASKQRPTEHEILAHMVLPLMLALGWSEQLIAVEWNHIDLAAFSGTPTNNGSCVLVCEAKRRGAGLQNAYDQAIDYVKRLGLSNCHWVLLTEGMRFYLYARRPEGWPDTPQQYVNVSKIRTCNIAPAGSNGVDTIVALTPMRR